MRSAVVRGLSIAVWSLVFGLGSAGAVYSSSGWHGGALADLVDEQAAETLAAGVAELQARIDSLAERGGEPAELSALYRDLLSKVAWLAEVQFYELQQQAADAAGAADEAAEDEARLYERYRAEVTAATLAVADEWVARLPANLDAHLARLDLERDPERNALLLDAVVARFPDRVEPIERRAYALLWQGEETQALELLQGFLDDHPDSSPAHRALRDLYHGMGDTRSAAEVERVWIDGFPADPEVLRHRLDVLLEATVGEKPADPATVAELELLAEDLLAAPLDVVELLEVCNGLAESLTAPAAACVDEVEHRDGDGRYASWVRAQRANLATAAGDLASFEETLVGLAAAEAARSRLQMAAVRAGEGDCDSALRLLEPVLADSLSASGDRAAMLRALAECGDATRADAVADALLREMSADEIRGLVYFLQEHVSADLVETRLLERLVLEPESTALHQALQYVYSEGDDPERAFAHLLTWAALDRESAAPLAKLSEALAERSRFSEAIEHRREAAQREPRNPSHRRKLFDLFLAAERPGAARSLAERLRDSARSPERLQGLELLARLAEREGHGDEALDLYETYLAESEADASHSVRRGYLAALRDAGRHGDLVAYLERRFEKEQAQGSWRSREAYLASSLQQLEMPQLALPFLRSVLARAPRNPQWHLEMGETLAALGHLDEATPHYLRAAELAPDDAFKVRGVAEFLLERGRFAEAAELLLPVAGDPSEYAEPSILLARAYRGLGRFDEAIDALVAVLDAAPDEHEAELELARVYEAKGIDAEALRRFQAFVEATEKYVAMADSNCACYCEIVQTRSEVVALLAERRADVPRDSAAVAVEAVPDAVPTRPQG